MHGWRSGLVSSVVAAAMLLVPAGVSTAARAAGGCSLSLSGTPQVGQAISIAGAGYPANASADVVFSVSGHQTDAFGITSDAAGMFRIDLTLETADLGPTTVTASVAGTACTAEVSYTVVSAPRATPGPTPSPSPSSSVTPSGTPGASANPSATPKPTAKPKPTPTPRPRATPRATPRPSPTHRANATPRPGQTPRASRLPSATGAGAAAGAGGTTPPPTDGSTGGAGDGTPVTILALAAVAFLAVGLGGWLADRRREGQAAPRR